eukprot:3673224-Pyramimonas_sp.AAC.1
MRPQWGQWRDQCGQRDSGGGAGGDSEDSVVGTVVGQWDSDGGSGDSGTMVGTVAVGKERG